MRTSDFLQQAIERWIFLARDIFLLRIILVKGKPFLVRSPLYFSEENLRGFRARWTTSLLTSPETACENKMQPGEYIIGLWRDRHLAILFSWMRQTGILRGPSPRFWNQLPKLKQLSLAKL